jgi:hypothetical protein
MQRLSDPFVEASELFTKSPLTYFARPVWAKSSSMATRCRSSKTDAGAIKRNIQPNSRVPPRADVRHDAFCQGGAKRLVTQRLLCVWINFFANCATRTDRRSTSSLRTCSKISKASRRSDWDTTDVTPRIPEPLHCISSRPITGSASAKASMRPWSVRTEYLPRLFRLLFGISK